MLDILKLCSIRLPFAEGKTTFTVFEPSLYSRRGRSWASRKTASGGGDVESAEGYAEELELVYQAIPEHFRGTIVKVVKEEGRDSVLLRSSSKRCLNLSTDGSKSHSKNNVYFIYYRSGGIVQRCRCENEKSKAEGRLYGTCKDFRSQTYYLPPGGNIFFEPPKPDFLPDEGAVAPPKSASLLEREARVAKIVQRRLQRQKEEELKMKMKRTVNSGFLSV